MDNAYIDLCLHLLKYISNVDQNFPRNAGGHFIMLSQSIITQTNIAKVTIWNNTKNIPDFSPIYQKHVSTFKTATLLSGLLKLNLAILALLKCLKYHLSCKTLKNLSLPPPAHPNSQPKCPTSLQN